MGHCSVFLRFGGSWGNVSPKRGPFLDSKATARSRDDLKPGIEALHMVGMDNARLHFFVCLWVGHCSMVLIFE